jgi:hypothetical protein
LLPLLFCWLRSIAGGVLIVKGMGTTIFPAAHSPVHPSPRRIPASRCPANFPPARTLFLERGSSSSERHPRVRPPPARPLPPASRRLQSGRLFQAPVKFDPSTVGSTAPPTSPAGSHQLGRGGLAENSNTNINYPVVYNSDTLYYLERDYYKNASKNGVIWADQDTKFGNASQISKNSVLYGHNWTNYSARPASAAPVT